MTVRQGGFSLMEALISLLVLSVGLLGLGQLQAELWKSAGQLYAVSEAYLLSANDLERGLSAGATELTVLANRSVRSVSGYTEFDSVMHVAQRGWLTEMDISSHWQDTSGANSVRLRTAAYRPPTSDSRWVLDTDSSRDGD
jgi:Tfp pilus assembly protein PilV